MFQEQSIRGESTHISRATVRPMRLAQFIGQGRVVETLEAVVGSARRTGRRMPNILLIGPKGHGRRLLATMVVHELAAPTRTVLAQTIHSERHLTNILSEFKPGDVVILENVNRLPMQGQNKLADAMALGRIPSEDPECWNQQPLAPCTIIATTSGIEGSMYTPLRELFPVVLRLSAYSTRELKTILTEVALRSGCDLSEAARGRLLRISPGKAGPLVQLLEATCRLVRSSTDGHDRPVIQRRHVETVLATSAFDILGVELVKRNYLEELRMAGDNVPRNIATVLQWPKELVTQVEEQLVESGLIRICGRSVKLTLAARKFLHEVE